MPQDRVSLIHMHTRPQMLTHAPPYVASQQVNVEAAQEDEEGEAVVVRPDEVDLAEVAAVDSVVATVEVEASDEEVDEEEEVAAPLGELEVVLEVDEEAVVGEPAEARLAERRAVPTSSSSLTGTPEFSSQRARSISLSHATSSPASLSTERSASASSRHQRKVHHRQGSSTVCGIPSDRSWQQVFSVVWTTSTLVQVPRSCIWEPPRVLRSRTSQMSSGQREPSMPSSSRTARDETSSLWRRSAQMSSPSSRTLVTRKNTVSCCPWLTQSLPTSPSRIRHVS